MATIEKVDLEEKVKQNKKDSKPRKANPKRALKRQFNQN